MIQLFVEQRWFASLSRIDSINIETFFPLDPAKTTAVREIDAHESGGLILADAPTLFPVQFANDAFVRARLIPTAGDDHELYPPSRVRSPRFQNIGTATLWILTRQYVFDPPAGGAMTRSVGAHMYFDQYV